MGETRRQVYVVSDNIISSLGFTTEENFHNLKNDRIGITIHDEPHLYPSPMPLSLIDTSGLEARASELMQQYKSKRPADAYTRLEKMFLVSIGDAIADQHINLRSNRLLFIISSTKGNIDLLEERNRVIFSHKRLYLWELGRMVADFFQIAATPMIISNACISGSIAIMMAKRFIASGKYDQAIVTGGDIASEFVISGFQSFQSLSPGPCKPFDLNRNGLSLGEGCGTIILSTEPSPLLPSVVVAGGATSNDANHISGPSRTGEELSHAINQAIRESGINAEDIGYISAHGTATPYNDEMESKAIALSNLGDVPLNSFKGYWGHTLGAAGIIESVAAIKSLRENLLIRSSGFESSGVPVPVNVLSQHISTPVQACLKTASGFGGCNAAVVYKKI